MGQLRVRSLSPCLPETTANRGDCNAGEPEPIHLDLTLVATAARANPALGRTCLEFRLQAVAVGG